MNEVISSNTENENKEWYKVTLKWNHCLLRGQVQESPECTVPLCGLENTFTAISQSRGYNEFSMDE